ncbi:MAG: diguanylate cyclase domain-containing protein [Candidatus Micrarchaeia archaeon]
MARKASGVSVMRKSVSRIHFLLDVARRVNASLNAEKTYSVIVRAALVGLNADGAALRLARDGHLVPVAWSGKVNSDKLSAVKLGKSVTGKAASSKKALSVDVEKFKSYTGTSGFRFISSAPVIHRNKRAEVVGTLTVYRKLGGVFSGDSLEFLSVLAEEVASAVNNAHLHEELKTHHDELERASVTDALTGLYNRRFFRDFLGLKIENARRHKSCFSVLVCDLDGFKKINDESGHRAGDSVLEALATLFKENVRRGDVATRWGGDEFAFILPQANNKKAEAFRVKVERLVERFSKNSDGRVLLNGLPLSLSCGSATFNGKKPAHLTSDDLVLEADKKLYEKKKRRKKRRK